jgi:hypothetical protein
LLDGFSCDFIFDLRALFLLGSLMAGERNLRPVSAIQRIFVYHFVIVNVLAVVFAPSGKYREENRRHAGDKFPAVRGWEAFRPGKVQAINPNPGSRDRVAHAGNPHAPIPDPLAD